jgi:hypothetical protein
MANDSSGARAVRIRTWYGKLGYVVVAVALVYLAPIIPVGAAGAGILRSALTFALILLGARLFRGVDEEVAPPRPWWRMTAAVPSGILLGSVFALVALLSAVGYVGLTASTLPQKNVTLLPALLVNAVLSAVLAYLFYGSSRRLIREHRKGSGLAAR